MIGNATEKKWFDELIVELRLRQVHGSAIGDTVASAHELLDDTGRGAEETFGPARDYAAALELPARPRYEWVRTALWPSLLGLLAFLLFVQTASAWARSELLFVSPAQLALLATPVLLTALFPLYLDAVVRRVWLGIVLVAVSGLAGFFSGVVAPTTLADAWLAIPPVPWLIGSSVVMVVLSVMNTIRSSRPGSRDEIIDPRPDAPHRSEFGTRLFVTVTNWLFPLFALGMLGLVHTFR